MELLGLLGWGLMIIRMDKVKIVQNARLAGEEDSHL